MEKLKLILLLFSLAFFFSGCSTPTLEHTEEIVESTTQSRQANGKQVLLKEVLAIDDKLSIGVPKEFGEMGEEMLSIKYPSERRPTLVYTNGQGSVNVAINHTKTHLSSTELNDCYESVDRAFRNLHPSAKWFNSGMVEINDRMCFRLDLRIPALDTEIRNVMIGTELDGRLLIVSVNVIQKLEPEWMSTVEEIISTIRVTK